MKKVLIVVLVLCCVTISVMADSVTQMPYALTIEGEIRYGNYTGDVVKGVPEGYGIFNTSNENGFSWHYIGNWVNGIMHGRGATYWDDGAIEYGEYENGKFVFGFYNYDGVELEEYADYESSYVTRLVTNVSDENPEQTYVGNTKTHVYHESTCHYAVNLSDSNKIIFYTEEEAISAGYTHCKTCDQHK